MSVTSIENAIVREARHIFKNPKITKKDIMEWSTAEQAVRGGAKPGETVCYCPWIGIWASIKAENKSKIQPQEKKISGLTDGPGNDPCL